MFRARSDPGLANLFHRKRLSTLPANDRASRRNELLRIRLSIVPMETRNAYRGERNEHAAEPIERTRSPSFQRYRSIIRHRRRYTYTYDRERKIHRIAERRGALHLFAHAIVSPPWFLILLLRRRARPFFFVDSACVN